MLLASLLLSGAAFAQISPLVMVTPSDYNIMAASPNDKSCRPSIRIPNTFRLHTRCP